MLRPSGVDVQTLLPYPRSPVTLRLGRAKAPRDAVDCHLAFGVDAQVVVPGGVPPLAEV